MPVYMGTKLRGGGGRNPSLNFEEGVQAPLPDFKNIFF